MVRFLRIKYTQYTIKCSRQIQRVKQNYSLSFLMKKMESHENEMNLLTYGNLNDLYDIVRHNTESKTKYTQKSRGVRMSVKM